MSDDLVVYEKEGRIAWLTLNRPEALNAINLDLRDLLWVLLEAVRDDPDVGVVIFHGAGERAFCAGADVKEFGTAPSYISARDARRERDLWGQMLASPKPMIAAIHGWALGAGCELSLYCDFRVASADARFGLPEVNLGYIPSAGGTQTLVRQVPPGVALEMIMTGEAIDAFRALQIGLVDRVVDRSALVDEARALANSLLQRPEFGLRMAREALRAAADLPISQGLSVAELLGARARLEAGGTVEMRRLSEWTPDGG